MILTVSVLFPDAANEQVILGILGGAGTPSSSWSLRWRGSWP